jgi:hypothetical protein
MRFLKNVNKWHDSLDNKLWARHSWFHCRNHKNDNKEKANSHASYTFCITKKDLFMGGWVGVGQLLLAIPQTVQCRSTLIIVYSLLNLLKCQILQTWN